MPDLDQTARRSKSQAVLAGEVAISAWNSKSIGSGGRSGELKVLNRRETATEVLSNAASSGNVVG